MSIKKTRPKRSRPSSNLTIRMMDDRMATDRMAEMRGPGSIGGVQRPSAAQSNSAKDKQKETNTSRNR